MSKRGSEPGLVFERKVRGGFYTLNCCVKLLMVRILVKG